MIRSIGVVLLLRGFNNPAVIYFRKDLDYRRDALWRSCGVLGSLAIGIAIAIVYRSVWALVISVVSAQAIETAASYVLVSHRPRFSLDRAKGRELMKFGKWILWSNMFVCLNLYLDSVVVGRFLGTASLGSYQVAAQLAMAPTALLGTHISGLSFPALSKLGSKEEMGRAFFKMLRVLGIVIFPFCCMLTLFAGPIVRTVLGPQWLASVVIVRTLGWAGLGMALSGLAGAALLACGRPDLPFRASALRTAALLLLLYPLVQTRGAFGVALAVASAALLACVYTLLLVSRLLRIRWGDFTASLRWIAAAAAPFFVARWIAGESTSTASLAVLVATVAIHAGVIVQTIRSEIKDRA